MKRRPFELRKYNKFHIFEVNSWNGESESIICVCMRCTLILSFLPHSYSFQNFIFTRKPFSSTFCLSILVKLLISWSKHSDQSLFDSCRIYLMCDSFTFSVVRRITWLHLVLFSMISMHLRIIFWLEKRMWCDDGSSWATQNKVIPNGSHALE